MKKILLFVAIGMAFAPLYGMKRKKREDTGAERTEEPKRWKFAGKFTGKAVEVETSDGDTIEIPLSLSNKSRTIQNMIEDLGDTKETIPLPIPTSVLHDLITYHSFRKASMEKHMSYLDLVPHSDSLPVHSRLMNLLGAVYYLDLKDQYENEITDLVIDALSTEKNRTEFLNGTLNPSELTNAEDVLKKRLIEKMEPCLIKFALSQPSTILQKNPDLNFRTVVFSDKNYVINESEEGLEIHDPETSTNLLLEESVGVDSVIISPNGKYIAAFFDGSNVIRIWEIETGNELHTLESVDEVTSVQISPNSESIVASSVDGTTKIWDINSGELLHTLKGHKKGIYSLAISPDGHSVVTGSDDSSKIWDMNSGNLLHTLDDDIRSIYSLAISPDSKSVVTGFYNGTKIWDMNSGELLHTLEGHPGPIYSVAISPDGKYVVTGSADTTAKIWDMNSGNLLHTLEGHTGIIFSVAISPDSTFVVTSSNDDGSTKIWDMNSGSLLHTFMSSRDSFQISPDGNDIIFPQNDEVKISKTKDNELIRNLTEDYLNQVLLAYFACFYPEDAIGNKEQFKNLSIRYPSTDKIKEFINYLLSD